MASTLPTLYLVRHGATAWTDSHQHTGRTDLPLNERGEAHAHRDQQEIASLARDAEQPASVVLNWTSALPR